MSKEVGDEYSSSLADLTMNSKPLINMLTILAEESIVHAEVIVQSVEKHLDKVHPEIKLPVLYLVDSIIKNVGGAYTQLFSQGIVNMFCKVFKQVDEKTRSQMFKLRETWHDVFPSIKLYQLDVKVSLIDPAWPIQAQPPQNNIHVNPNFFKKPGSTTPTQVGANATSVSSAPIVTLSTAEEEMLNAVARKEQELLVLQKKKIEMELEQTRRQLAEQRKAFEKNSALQSTVPVLVTTPMTSANALTTKVRQVPVNAIGNTGRIAPVSAALVNARRRDPRLARHMPPALPTITPAPVSLPPQPIFQPPPLPTLHFDLGPPDLRPRKVDSRQYDSRQHDLRTDSKLQDTALSSRKDPRLNSRTNNKSSKSSSKRSRSPSKHTNNRSTIPKRDKTLNSSDSLKNNLLRVGKLPPIPKIKSKVADDTVSTTSDISSPSKRKKDNSVSPRSNGKSKKAKDSSPKATNAEAKRSPSELKKTKVKPKYDPADVEQTVEESPADVTFNQLKSSTKERNYIRRNRKSESPEVADLDLRGSELPLVVPAAIVPDVLGNGDAAQDVDLRVIVDIPSVPAPVTRKRPSTDSLEQVNPKKSKSEKFDALFGNEDVDLRTLPLVDNPTPPPPPIISLDVEEVPEDSGWARLKEAPSPASPTRTQPSHLDLVRAKLAEATKSKDRLGRSPLYNNSDDSKDRKKDKLRNSEDTDMRKRSGHDNEARLEGNMKNMLTQAEEQLKSGHIDRDLIVKVLRLNEKKKLNEAKKQEQLEISKRKLDRLEKLEKEKEPLPISDDDTDGSSSPGSDMSDIMRKPVPNTVVYGDIDERIPSLPVTPANPSNEGGKRAPLLPLPDHFDSDLRIHPRMQLPSDGPYNPQNSDMRFSGRSHNAVDPWGYNNRPWRGNRPRMEDWGGNHNMRSRGLQSGNWRMTANNRAPFDSGPRQSFDSGSRPPVEGNRLVPDPTVPYRSDGKAPPPLGSPACKEFPPVDPRIIEYVEHDTMRTILIDGVAREIRYYDREAVVMLDWDEPRDISFQPGQRRVYLDDEAFLLGFNDDYTNVLIDGEPHRMRFGAPTRELFIDDMWFECLFGGPPLPIRLNGKIKFLKLDGPPPQVSIGSKKRTDLVAGKINLIVNGTSMLPVFLDAKPQTFKVESVIHTLRFVDSLQTILINEKPFDVEFGGLPKPIFVGKRKRFIRFSILPPDIKAGHVKIRNMEGYQPADKEASPNPDKKVIEDVPIEVSVEVKDTIAGLTENENKAETEILPIVNSEKVTNDHGLSGGLDMLASLMSSSMAPASQFGGYSRADSTESSQPSAIPGLGTDITIPPPNLTSVLQNLNVNDLFAKLVASGIVNTLGTTAAPVPAEPVAPAPVSTPITVKAPEKTKNASNNIKPVNLLRPETLKFAQPGLVAALHTGMQCGSCGVRFPPEHTVRYSQHLDWHFRQNRADRDSQRRPHSRRWHYDIPDWIQYEEIEDLEEREKSWFERQQQAAESESSEVAAAEAVAAAAEAASVRAGAAPSDLRCELCRDSFDQFYNQDSEEWHLRKAVRHLEKNFHPLCLEEYKASLLEKEAVTDVSSVDDILNSEKDITEDQIEENEISKSEEVIDDPPSQEDSIADKDSESDVEVISESLSEIAVPEEDIQDVEVLEEDDDVVIKTEPVEQIIVDDVDTDEETEMERAARDNDPDVIPIDFKNIKIKQEPIDPDDEPIITAITSEGVITTQADTTHASVLSSIDGNVQLEPTLQSVPVIPVGGIRINITKSLVSQQPKEAVPAPVEDSEASDEPLPPGEELEIEYKVKPSLEGVVFSKQPPTNRGSELSALCSIM